jgi:hypothetical protein
LKLIKAEVTACDFTQGMGIAFVAARVAQLPVNVVDPDIKQIEKGLAYIGSGSIAAPSSAFIT